MSIQKVCDICISTRNESSFITMKECCQNIACSNCVTRHIGIVKAIECLFCHEILSFEFCREQKIVKSQEMYNSLHPVIRNFLSDYREKSNVGMEKFLHLLRFVQKEIPRMFFQFCYLVSYHRDNWAEYSDKSLYPLVLESFVHIVNKCIEENPDYFIGDLSYKFLRDELRILQDPEFQYLFSEMRESIMEIVCTVEECRYYGPSTSTFYSNRWKDNRPDEFAGIKLFYYLFNRCHSIIRKDFFSYDYRKLFLEYSQLRISKYTYLDSYPDYIERMEHEYDDDVFHSKRHFNHVAYLFIVNMNTDKNMTLINLILLFMDPFYQLGSHDEDGKLLENHLDLPDDQVENEIVRPRVKSKTNLYFVCNSCNSEDLPYDSDSSESHCRTCEDNFCSSCSLTYEEAHECKDKEKEKLSSIIYTLCPRCYTKIQKIEGCNQMFCTNCHAKFDYMTGKFYRNEDDFHNDHHTEYMNSLTKKVENNSNEVLSNSSLITDVSFQQSLEKIQKMDRDILEISVEDNLNYIDLYEIYDVLTVLISKSFDNITSSHRFTSAIHDSHFRNLHNHIQKDFISFEELGIKSPVTMITRSLTTSKACDKRIFAMTVEDEIFLMTFTDFRNDAVMRINWTRPDDGILYHHLYYRKKCKKERFGRYYINISDQIIFNMLIDKMILEMAQQIVTINLRFCGQFISKVMPKILEPTDVVLSKEILDDIENLLNKYFLNLYQLFTMSNNQHKDIFLEMMRKKHIDFLRSTEISKKIFGSAIMLNEIWKLKIE